MSSSSDWAGAARPSRTPWAMLVLVALVVSSFGTAEPRAQAQEPARPNILVIVVDDMRAGLVRAMPKTLRWLYEGGTWYRRSFTPVPLCCPARASIFSGRYIHNHTVKKNNQVEKLDQATTMQRYLSEAGYRTGMAGKYFID